MPDALWTELTERALLAQQHAHAPYSQFRVAAALLTADGSVFARVNVENASFGLTLCAEQTAVAAAVAGGRTQFTRLAIASPGGLPPCGACRQVLAEFCDDLPILLVDSLQPSNTRQTSLSELLPDRFARLWNHSAR